MYLGDFAEDADIFFKFSTRAFATGIPTTLTSGVLSVYKDEGGAASEKTTAEAYFDLDLDHDSISGWHNVRIDLSGDAFFATGADYSIVITTGTVASVSVVGENIATFSIENRSMGQPAGATLAADIAALKAETALIVADTNELQGDDIPTLIADVPTVSEFEARTIVAASYFDPAADTVAQVTLVDTVTANTDLVTAAVIADAVWDEALTGSSHNAATSAGRRLRQVEEAFVHASGTVAVVTNDHTLTLDTGALASADHYLGDRLQITEGTGAGQSRIIIAYSVGRVAILDSDFVVTPDASSLYDIVAADVHVSVSDADLAEGFIASVTSASQFVLDAATAVANADYYNGNLIVFTHGTGIGQSREIISYSAGREVVVSPAFDVAPDTTTTFHIVAAVSAAEIADEVWDEPVAGHTTAGTFGKTDADTLADTDELQQDDTPGAIAALNDLSAANVATELATYDGPTRTEATSDKDAIITDLDDIKGTGFVKDTHSLIDLEAFVDGIETQTDKMVFTSAGRIDSNVEAINDITAAAVKQAAIAMETLPVTFTTSGGSTTAAVLNQVDGSGASAVDDVYNGRILVFNLGTLNHQVAEITNYDGGTLTATISAVTTAPTSSHTARMI